jgi:hypothetical protein
MKRTDFNPGRAAGCWWQLYWWSFRADVWLRNRVCRVLYRVRLWAWRRANAR